MMLLALKLRGKVNMFATVNGVFWLNVDAPRSALLMTVPFLISAMTMSFASSSTETPITSSDFMPAGNE